MALTLQRKLELAGALSKVQPQLIRLHLMSPPKNRHRVRNGILVGSAIALAAIVAAGAFRRRGGLTGHALPEVEELAAERDGARPLDFVVDGVPDGELESVS